MAVKSQSKWDVSMAKIIELLLIFKPIFEACHLQGISYGNNRQDI